MRKGIVAGSITNIRFTQTELDKIKTKGYKYVQVSGLTSDKHFDYTEPHFLILYPMKDLPSDPAKKDIYEPVESELLIQWANEKDEHLEIVIARNSL